MAMRNGHRRLGQAQSSTHIRHISQIHLWHMSLSGTAAWQEADCRTSSVTQAKPWNRWVLMPATCAATGTGSIKPYLAQCAVLTTHHHGRCGVSASSALKRSKMSRGGVTAACRQASGTWESGHGLGYLRRSASLAISGCPPRFRQRHDRDHPLALSRPSRHAVVSWEALAGWCTRMWVSIQCKCNIFKYY